MKLGVTTDTWFEFTERVVETEKGVLMPESDHTEGSARLYAVPGTRIPLDTAKTLGLVEKPKARKPVRNKARKKTEDK